MHQSLAAHRNILLTAVLIALAVLTYWPSTHALWAFWTNDNTAGAHGFLVAPLAAWLLFRARDRLETIRARPSWLAGALLVLCSIAWLVFWRASIQELHLLLLPVLMGLAVTTALGWQAAWIVAFPIGYLYFAVPAWGVCIEPLEMLTVRAMGVLAPLIGVPAHIEGTLVVMPNGIIEVAHGCSGQAFFTVGLAVAALLGELESASLARRALLFAVMGALAVISNWLRVLVIVDAGYTTNMRHVLVSRGHFVFGWILFTVVLVTGVWFLARAATPQPGASQGAAGPRDVPARMPTYAAAAAALIAMPLVVYIFVAARDSQAAPLAFQAPVGRGEWRGPISTFGNAWQPEFVGDHSQWYFAYQNMSGHNVELVAIGYPLQEQGRELVNEENALLGATATSLTAQNEVRLDEGSYVELMGSDAQGRRWLVWSVYDIGGREFVSPLMSQLWYGVRSLGGAPYSVQFAFRTACEPASCDAARAVLKSFAREMGPQCFASFGRAARSPKLRPL
jgi:EpsI family protein